MCWSAGTTSGGGVFADIVTYSHYRQFGAGLRIAINPHGGHYWSHPGTPVCFALGWPCNCLLGCQT